MNWDRSVHSTLVCATSQFKRVSPPVVRSKRGICPTAYRDESLQGSFLGLEQAGAASEMTFDDGYATRLALEHLRGQRREKSVYRDSVRGQGLPSEPKRSPRAWESAAPINSVNSEGSVMGARKVISSLVDRDNLPNAVETFNDVTAIGAMNDFAPAGKSIPGDSAAMGGRHRPELAADSGPTVP